MKIYPILIFIKGGDLPLLLPSPSLGLAETPPITVAIGSSSTSSWSLLPASSPQPCESNPFPALTLTRFSIVLTIRQFLFPHLSFPGCICVLSCLLYTTANACQEPRFLWSILHQHAFIWGWGCCVNGLCCTNPIRLPLTISLSGT